MHTFRKHELRCAATLITVTTHTHLYAFQYRRVIIFIGLVQHCTIQGVNGKRAFALAPLANKTSNRIACNYAVRHSGSAFNWNVTRDLSHHRRRHGSVIAARCAWNGSRVCLYFILFAAVSAHCTKKGFVRYPQFWSHSHVYPEIIPKWITCTRFNIMSCVRFGSVTNCCRNGRKSHTHTRITKRGCTRIV